MMNKNDIRSLELSNVSSVEVIPESNSYYRRKKSGEACARLIHSAQILPAGGTIGWQIESGGFANHVFTSAGVDLDGADIDWMFAKCAKADPKRPAEMTDVFAPGRRVYVLIPANDRASGAEESGERDDSRDYEYHDEYESEDREEIFCEMLAMMREAGAIMRILISAGEPGAQASVLISVPGALTLRMRSVVSMCFGRTYAAELSGDVAADFVLPAGRVRTGTAALLGALMKLPEEQKEEETFDDDDDEFDFDDDEDEDSRSEDSGRKDEGGEDGGDSAGGIDLDDSTPVEDLEFRCRTFNCLKRAGLDTVGQIREKTDEELMKMRNLGCNGLKEIRAKVGEYREKKVAPQAKLSYTEVLEGLVGLGGVKEQVRKIAAFARMKKAYAADESAAIPVNLNMEFVGNPGTAKTTVARIVAGILFEIGLLKSAETVEVGRADLVAEYSGQTAVKVKNVFNKAKGKLLFIDEAYSLSDRWQGGYGDEAINTLVQEMENRRCDTVVIFAGYPERMGEFFARNPGLRSRVPFSIRFDDYSADDMAQIAGIEARRRGFSVAPEAEARVKELCAVTKSAADAGNGRFCRNLVENAILNFALRVFGAESGSSQEERVLSAGDFTPPPETKEKSFSPRIGFCA